MSGLIGLPQYRVRDGQVSNSHRRHSDTLLSQRALIHWLDGPMNPGVSPRRAGLCLPSNASAILRFERIAHLIGWATVDARSKRGKFTTAVEATATLCFRCVLASVNTPLLGRFGNRCRLRPGAIAKRRCDCFCAWHGQIELQRHYTGSEVSRTMHLICRYVT